MEILNVGSTPDVVRGALYDGKVGAARYVMGNPGAVERQEPLGYFDSGDPNGLIVTAKWLFEQHPAERYGLVLWRHGSGWEPGCESARGPDADRHDNSLNPLTFAGYNLCAYSQKAAQRPFGNQALTVKPVTPLRPPPRDTRLKVQTDDPSPSAQEFRLLLKGLAHI